MPHSAGGDIVPLTTTGETTIGRALTRFVLRLFFRRLEVIGAERVPPAGATLLVLNHPNALVDPMLVLALSPRPVVFLAKAPLFRLPVLGQLVRASGAIPVERPQDPGGDVSRNQAMFAQVHQALASERCIALFPEGTSHSDPHLHPFKTGAARIALGAASAGIDVRIVPAGLFYTAKSTFRSGALLSVGEPIVVPADTGRAGDQDPGAVRALTDRLEEALARVTLQADRHDSMTIASRVELLLTSGDAADGSRLPLAEQLALRRRLVSSLQRIRTTRPAELARVGERVALFETKLARAGLDTETFNYQLPGAGAAAMTTVRMLLYVIIVLPVAAAGLVMHYPAYRLIGIVAASATRTSSDVEATAKIVMATLLFPLTWLIVGLVVGRMGGSAAGWSAAVLAPGAGFVGLRLVERLDRFIGEGKGVLLSVVRPVEYRALMVERATLREAILALDPGDGEG
ncbi:MAG: 1-acyl-sn-glycerol-3-phosphate acyltransferase [Gemmatimonadales bacterium]|nr:1-acyl-sn-glycerol-3-phosphate acyltransferase [Gemmatimonadales bacterium]